MNRNLLALFLVLAMPPAFAQQPMNNQAVIKMVKAGLSDSIMVSAIQSSPGEYNTSTDGLIALKQAGVDDTVVAAMFAKNSGVAASPAAGSATSVPSPANPDDPDAPHEAGIYIYDAKATDHKMSELEPSVYSQGKTGGVWASAMTYGIAKAKTKAVIRSAHSNARVTDPNVSFYFYFEKTSAGLGNASSPYGGTTTTPNEFTLLRLDVKGDTRETTIGKFSAYGSQGGNDDKAVVSFAFEKIRPGVYKVTPKAPLPQGEYGFVSASGTPMVGYFGAAAASGAHVFDFGVD
jgi:hypothetical protein